MLSVYELNLHTTRGDASAYERDRLVAGAVSGSALAKKILECFSLGIDPVMVYTLAQHETPTWDIVGAVKLWGVTRSFGPPLVLRPTGLAVALLNRVVEAPMYRIKGGAQETEGLTMGAFQHEGYWAAAIVSERPEPLVLELTFPEDGRAAPRALLSLEAQKPFDTNEKEEKVKITEKNLEAQGQTVRFSIPPWGFIVLY